ncbi:ead/Ea22-like family protein [Klebsiella pneumoniae]|uniref:ead/Ea22-like family protein n=1 Tax=Klebsiella pneumoniae TaxID=573 RepID=UPI002E19F877|nr:ead/Ea22-like family protein [Klebsiella pneumoniae]
MTDITELAKAAEKYRSTLEAHRNNPRDGVALNAWDDATSKFMELVDNDELNIISGLLEALEKAKGMEAYWKTQCRGITDHCEELQARIAELESRTVTVKQCEVLVTVAGFTGCGKSAIAGEIEIAMKAIGVPVTWANGDSEKRMTGADWLTAIEMYKPTVRIVEENIPRAAGFKVEAE